MSRFEKNNQPVKLDANGNLDTSVLERELTAALEFDVRYKQQDNMKKQKKAQEVQLKKKCKSLLKGLPKLNGQNMVCFV